MKPVLPPGFTVLNSIFLGALLWIGSQLPKWVAFGLTLASAYAPEISAAPISDGE